MPTTLYLDPDTWDLTLDASRNIALADEPYSSAQSVANACRLWRGEAPFNAGRGMPYEDQILGKQPPQRVLAGWYEAEALSVPTVASATAVLVYAGESRSLSGQIQCTLIDGTVINV
ncbi:hypothetical protein MAJJADAN_00039 [Pseudomonas phage Amjad_SA]|nr:hypothetical protein MAJJADAN_00039 [Pseudomonas phage Amjad_SA]